MIKTDEKSNKTLLRFKSSHVIGLKMQENSENYEDKITNNAKT